MKRTNFPEEKMAGAVVGFTSPFPLSPTSLFRQCVLMFSVVTRRIRCCCHQTCSTGKRPEMLQRTGIVPHNKKLLTQNVHRTMVEKPCLILTFWPKASRHWLRLTPMCWSDCETSDIWHAGLSFNLHFAFNYFE